MKLNVSQRHFVEGLGQDMVGWGLSRTTGLTYAYLLLHSEPASLDEIVAELGVAKSGASVATRQLVTIGLARAIGERGSRRVRYQALLDIDAVFAARNAQTQVFLARVREGAVAAPAGPVRRQLSTMASQIEDFIGEIPALLRRIRERRRP
jgi:DNA-binding transcriptional regulator GbsR (MarR family)